MSQLADEILSYFGHADSIKNDSIDILHTDTDNPVAEEIASYYGFAEYLESEELKHYGIKFRSGRYPYGSGEEPYQHDRDFMGRIQQLRKENFTYKDETTGKTYSGDTAIAKSMGLTSSELRRQISWAKYERRLNDVETAKALRKDGLGYTEIGRKMGKNESTVRSLLDSGREDKMNQALETAGMLKEQLDKKGMIDIGGGVEKSLGISKERLDLALDYLQKVEGCNVYSGRIPQPTNPGQHTTQTVLCKPGTKHSDIYDYEKVQSLDDYVSHDGGDTYQRKFTYPTSLDSKRMMIRYAEDKGPDGFTGDEKDGTIELRRGVKDLSLGESRYSQVRIMVDGTHYLKGMAVYSDDMPDGVDVIFNTNKKRGTPQGDVLKKIKDDSDNPFGSLIKDADQGGQYWYDPKTGKQVGSDGPDAKLGLINKRADQGDWSEWANALPSQFLGKQSKTLAKKQLDLAKKDKLAEFEEYCNLTNPTIKKHMLEKFADNCDSAAVHLKAAALPGQRYHVIVPINSLNDNEVYAPNYKNGTKLALIRYPHGGTFEIPILTVNNKNTLANKVIGKESQDAIGINKRIADRLSGADFDGDTVMCIPTHDSGNKVKIASQPLLKGLIGFDPKTSYGGTRTVDENGEEHWTRNGHEYPIMKDTQKQMGVISNLITDMTIAGATPNELARAVRHSMVVIDAEKHKLDYKASEIENNIASLKSKYQIQIMPDGSIKEGGASTILSRAKGDYNVRRRQGSYKINIPGSKQYDPSRPDGAKLWKEADDLYYPARQKSKKYPGMIEITKEDGKKIVYDPKNKSDYDKYNPVQRVDEKTGETYFTDKSGTIRYRTDYRKTISTRMAETDDAETLVSKYRHPMELIYADYANSMKELGNRARMEIANTNKIQYSAEAKKQYQAEVDSLNNKLKNAELNRPRERQALRLANAEIEAKRKAKPDMSKEDLKKLRQRTVTKYRAEVGAVSRRDRNIPITDKEWEAIQKGAISENTLKKILNNTDIDELRQRATPKLTTSPSSIQISRMKALAASNYSLAEIAQKTGFSTATISKYLKGVK